MSRALTTASTSGRDLRGQAGRTLRTPAGREGDGLGEAALFRLVRMGGRYIWGSRMGGSGIDVVLSSICMLAALSMLVLQEIILLMMSSQGNLWPQHGVKGQHWEASR